MSRCGWILGLLTLLAPSCASKQVATKVQLPASVLADDATAEETVVLPENVVHISEKSAGMADASVEPRQQVRSIILPDETDVNASGPGTSLAQRSQPPSVDLPARIAGEADFGRQTRWPSDAEPLPDWSLQINDILTRLQRTDPEQAREFAQAVREAAAGDRLPQVLAAWQATTDFLQRSQPATSSLSNAALDEDVPQTPRQWDASATERTISGAKEPAPERAMERSAGSERTVDAARLPQSRGEERETVLDADDPTGSLDRQLAGEIRRTVAEDGVRRIEYRRETTPAASDAAKRKPSSPADIPAQMRELALSLQAGDSPALRDQAASRLLFALGGEPSRALAPIEGVDSVDRDFWLHMIRAQMLSLEGDDFAPIEAQSAEIADELRLALATVETRADLSVSTPILCKKVNNFGNYEEFDEYRFVPGDSLVVYWEVRNFESVPTKKGMRTSLDANFELYNRDGKRIRQSHHPFMDDYCEKKRSDYFNAVLYSLPADIRSGDYVLKVTVHDKSSDKVAENQCRFTIK